MLLLIESRNLSDVVLAAPPLALGSFPDDPAVLFRALLLLAPSRLVAELEADSFARLLFPFSVSISRRNSLSASCSFSAGDCSADAD